jgi:signal transduction histidine kinase
VIIDEKRFISAIDDSIASAFFRILQESLSNITKHANATRIVINLEHGGDWLLMSVGDNGIGVQPESNQKSDSFGLLGIGERVRALNGTMTLESDPGSGTVLTIVVPVEAP